MYVLVEQEASGLSDIAPDGAQPFNVIVQANGSTVISEILQPAEDISDERALPLNKGELYANILRKKATRIIEEISRLDLEIRNALESLQDLQEKQNKLLEHTPDYHFARREALINMIGFLFVAIGEIGPLFVLFSDIFGLDPMKLSRELVKHPLSIFFTICLSVSFFAMTLLTAEMAFRSKHRALWVLALALIAYLTARLRASQTVSMGEAEITPVLLTLLFMIIGFALPLAAAFFYITWQEARKLTGLADSMARRLAEEETRVNNSFKETTRNRETAEKELEGLIEEYIRHYQKAQEERKRTVAAWERHRRWTEAYLADVKLAYLFWQGWRQRRENISREVKKLLQITGVLFLALAVSLGSIRVAYAEATFNIVALCDRSTSANQYSCTPDILSSLGQLWIRKADDAGGGTFELFLIDQSFDTTTVLFSATYPDHFPGPVSMHKKKWKNEFLRDLSVKLKDLPSKTGSAIIEAIHRASLRMPDAGETVIYVLSDMREVNGAFNFEKRVPTEKEFSRWLKKEAIEPRFKEVNNIVVCGIHPYTPEDTSRMTTQNYDQLLKLWQGIFKTWGVRASLSESCDFKTTKEE